MLHPSQKPSFSSVAENVQTELQQLEQTLTTMLQDMPSPIKEVSQHLVHSGGKRIRPTLLFLCTKLLGPVTPKHLEAAACIELIHNATLLHDDVIDSSDVRRGKPTAHTVWSQHHSILSGDFLLCKALETLSHIEDWPTLRLIHASACDVIIGQTKELMETNLPIGAQKEHYLDVIRLKTASLFETSATLPCLLSSAENLKDAFQTFGYHVGMCFQLVDDFLDYQGTQERTGKAPGQDFREGKVTLPLILAYQESTPQEQMFLENVFSSPQKQEKDFEDVLALLEKKKAFQKTMEVINTHIAGAEKTLSSLPNLPLKDKILEVIFAIQGQLS